MHCTPFELVLHVHVVFGSDPGSPPSVSVTKVNYGLMSCGFGSDHTLLHHLQLLHDQCRWLYTKHVLRLVMYPVPVPGKRPSDLSVLHTTTHVVLRRIYYIWVCRHRCLPDTINVGTMMSDLAKQFAYNASTSSREAHHTQQTGFIYYTWRRAWSSLHGPGYLLALYYDCS